jgi:hypothetical protein
MKNKNACLGCNTRWDSAYAEGQCSKCRRCLHCCTLRMMHNTCAEREHRATAHLSPIEFDARLRKQESADLVKMRKW